MPIRGYIALGIVTVAVALIIYLAPRPLDDPYPGARAFDNFLTIATGRDREEWGTPDRFFEVSNRFSDDDFLPSLERAYPYAEQAADVGHPGGLWVIYQSYAVGVLRPLDRAKSREYLLKAVETGHPGMRMVLGLEMMNKMLPDDDPVKGEATLIDLSKGGYMWAQIMLMNQYLMDAFKDVAKATELFCMLPADQKALWVDHFETPPFCQKGGDG